MATKGDIYMKTNFRELLHMIALRTSPAAHPDIRNIFLQIKQICEYHLPELFVELATEN